MDKVLDLKNINIQGSSRSDKTNEWIKDALKSVIALPTR